MTRELEMVKAYRDTWELGLHSYLTYLRDRLLVARGLLTLSGSVFVQISDENVHHVRELMDEVFGAENFVSLISFRKTAAVSSPMARLNSLASSSDYVLWYARDLERIKYRQLFLQKTPGGEGSGEYLISSTSTASGARSRVRSGAVRQVSPDRGRLYRQDNLTSSGHSDELSQPFTFDGHTYELRRGLHWKTTRKGLERLADQGRLESAGHLALVMSGTSMTFPFSRSSTSGRTRAGASARTSSTSFKPPRRSSQRAC